MSPFDQPQIPPEIPTAGSSFSTSVQSELSRNLDIAAARQFFQPTGAEAALPPISTGGAESAALASNPAAFTPSFEGAMLPGGPEGAAAMAAKSAINPMIQLILRLPGVLGAGTGFFEFLAALFLPGTNLIEAFNPVMWANQLAGGIASLKTSLLTSAAGEHMTTSLSMLSSHAPIFHQLGMNMNMSMNGFSDMHLHSFSGDGLTSSNQFNIEQLNTSGPLDLKKPQFEIGSGSAMNKLALRHDGLLSGPSVNPDFSTTHLAGAQRLFSDQITSGGSVFSNASSSASSTIVSASGVPAGSASSLNIGSNSFGQDVGSMPANYQLGEGAISGPGMSGNVGYQMSGAQPSLDAAPKLSPSGRISDTLGGNQPTMVAQNNNLPEYYRPSMSNGGYNVPTEAAPTGDATGAGASSSGGLTGLRAEPMSILKKPIGTNHHTDLKNIDSIGHQTKGTLSHQPQSSRAVDQISHRSTPKAYGQSRASHVSTPRHDSIQSAVPRNQQIAQPSQQQAVDGQYQQAQPGADQAQAQPGADQPQQGQQAQAGDQIQQPTDAKVEGVENYTVKHGDCLWDIAKKHFGDGTKWTEIYKANADAIGGNPDLIHSGLELKLPGADASQATASAGHYSVQPGDNLWDIAHDQLGDGTKWGEIYKANTQVIGDNPRLILPGQELQIPGGQPLVSQAPPAADPTMGLQTSSAPSTVPMQGGDPSAGMGQPVGQPMANAPMQMQQAPMLQHQPAAVQPDTISMRPQGQPSPMMQSIPDPGPGAAIAATLDAPPSPIVSSSLAPDLSFLNPQKK